MGSVQPEVRTPASLFLVERYWPGVTVAALGEAIARLHEASESQTGCHAGVRHLGSTLVADDETVFCIFAATSIDAVAEVNCQAHVATDRISPCVCFPTPGDVALELTPGAA